MSFCSLSIHRLTSCFFNSNFWATSWSTSVFSFLVAVRTVLFLFWRIMLYVQKNWYIVSLKRNEGILYALDKHIISQEFAVSPVLRVKCVISWFNHLEFCPGILSALQNIFANVLCRDRKSFNDRVNWSIPKDFSFF